MIPDDSLHFSGIQAQVLQSPGQAVRHLRRRQSGEQLGRVFGEKCFFNPSETGNKEVPRACHYVSSSATMGLRGSWLHSLFHGALSTTEPNHRAVAETGWLISFAGRSSLEAHRGEAAPANLHS